ncbi:MAG TPA: hypothetical protein VFN42_01780 [Acetobacteraceae bacterium]|nr:hypothetical protein [Acetobacteraceae bacterium]
MSVIAIETDLHGATRVFFDYRAAPADGTDERRIERAIVQALAADRLLSRDHAIEPTR